jgi:ADP-heptose:LPS heptosyltransferase
MINSQVYTEIEQPPQKRISFKQLYAIAFTGQYELVRSEFIELPKDEREYYNDKEILRQVIWGSLQRINQLKAVFNYEVVETETEFLLETMEQFLDFSLSNRSYPRELYQAIIYVSEELITQSKLVEAAKYLNTAIDIGINKFPNLRVEVINKLSALFNKKGNIEKSSAELHKLANNPYLLTDRNQIAEIFYRLSQNSLKLGDIKSYKSILFLGLKYFYKNLDDRWKIYNQIRLTYRHSFSLFVKREVTLSNKFIYALHWIHFGFPNLAKIKLSFINRFINKSFLILLYLINYTRRSDSLANFRNINSNTYPKLLSTDANNSPVNQSVKKRKKILITRAMGGIGDLLMMTPGIHALKKKYPAREIHLAIPKRYFPLFYENEDVKLIDTESDFFARFESSRWYNFTDCPAARGESRKAPKVKKGRIELFARALGVKNLRLKLMNEKPRYFVTDDEKDFANIFWGELKLTGDKVIGIQLKADESYRNYPLMEQLVKKIAQMYKVLLFDGEKIDGFEFDNVIKIDSFSLRKAFALAHKCDVIIAPDSSFVHFAAAFDIPTVAIYGPIDAKVRTKFYPNCTYVDSRKSLGCLPCWRNENIPCKLTGMRNSACLEGITVQQIIEVLENKLKEIEHATLK